MRPKLLLLDEPCDKAKEILKHEFDLIRDNSAIPRVIYTQLTPVDMPSLNIPVVCPCTGIDHVKAKTIIYLDDDWKANAGREITSTAEHTFSLLLQLAKAKRMQLKDKIIGVIGYGRIGEQVAKYSSAFGMTSMIYDVKYQTSSYNLEQILQHADIVTVHVPLNLDTIGLIGKEQLGLMKDSALLINTSRANIVDYDALMQYENKIYYADDFGDTRPLCRRNTIQTNHIAGNSVEAREATDIYIATKTIEYWRSLNP